MNPIFQVEIQFFKLKFSYLVGTLEKGLQKLNSMKLCLKNFECLGQRKLHKCGFGIKKSYKLNMQLIVSDPLGLRPIRVNVID